MPTETIRCSPATASEAIIRSNGVTCITCNKTFPVTRSPRKGYKITLQGWLCDECYPKLQTTTVLEFGRGSEHYSSQAPVLGALPQIDLYQGVPQTISQLHLTDGDFGVFVTAVLARINMKRRTSSFWVCTGTGRPASDSRASGAAVRDCKSGSSVPAREQVRGRRRSRRGKSVRT